MLWFTFMTWSYDTTTQNRFIYMVFIERWFLWLCHGTAQLTGHKSLYYSRPPGAGGMVWVLQPCDISGYQTSSSPPAVPAIIQRLGSNPKIERLGIEQGLLVIFKCFSPMVNHLTSGLCVRRVVSPSSSIPGFEAATCSSPELRPTYIDPCR